MHLNLTEKCRIDRIKTEKCRTDSVSNALFRFVMQLDLTYFPKRYFDFENIRQYDKEILNKIM